MTDTGEDGVIGAATGTRRPLRELGLEFGVTGGALLVGTVEACGRMDDRGAGGLFASIFWTLADTLRGVMRGEGFKLERRGGAYGLAGGESSGPD